MTYFPEEVIEHIFSYLTSHRDRNSVSQVCKDWFVIDRNSRRHVFVGNCYVVEPARVTARFPGLRSLSVKGKPHFSDFNLVPHGWGGSATPWIEVMVRSCPGLEEIRFKRMVISDVCLELVARLFPNFKSLVLVQCEGFSTNGVSSIASHCRHFVYPYPLSNYVTLFDGVCLLRRVIIYFFIVS